MSRRTINRILYLHNILSRIAFKATNSTQNSKMLTLSLEIKSAVKLILSEDLASYAITVGINAVARYIAFKSQ